MLCQALSEILIKLVVSKKVSKSGSQSMCQGSWTECILIDLLFQNRLKLTCFDFRMHADGDKLLVLLPQLATNSASNLL